MPDSLKRNRHKCLYKDWYLNIHNIIIPYNPNWQVHKQKMTSSQNGALFNSRGKKDIGQDCYAQ